METHRAQTPAESIDERQAETPHTVAADIPPRGPEMTGRQDLVSDPEWASCIVRQCQSAIARLILGYEVHMTAIQRERKQSCSSVVNVL